MKITLSPTVWNRTLSVSKAGDTLTINDKTFDFSGVADNGILSAKDVGCEFIVDDVQRIGGDLQLTLLLPIGARASNSARFPDAIVDPADGPVQLPQ